MEWTIRATFVMLCIVFSLTSIHNVLAEQRVVCYYTNWSVYRPGTAKFSPQNINPYLCTHLIYAFGGFTKDNTLKPFDKYQDIEKGGYAKFNGLKTYNKQLKTMLAIGGWNEGSTRFSALVADPDRREELVKNSVKFLRQNHFDGLDLDWEYPAFRDGGKPRDKNNYADFVQELRAEFERESSKTGRPRLLLSMAIPAGIEYLEKGYDLPRLDEYLDFFNLLSYDYHSAFEPAVNHHSPLYGLEEDNEYNYDNELTIDYTISYLLKHEVTPNKLILGIPTYGRSYTLFNEEATEIGAPADGPGEEGDATREKGYLAYYEICENIGKSDEWEVIQPNPKAMGPYAVRGNQWVGYDDEEIVRLKAQYVNEKGLGGIMFWSIDNDDFRGKCHDRPYPLIEAAKEAMLTGNNRKIRPNPKTKSISDRKKNRHSSNNQQSSEDDSTGYRLKTGTNRRRTSSTPSSTRKRILSTSNNSRSSGKNRLNIEENDEEEVEDIASAGNSVRGSANKYHKSQSRTRANRVAPKRKVQSRRGDDPPEDEIEGGEESLSNKLTTPEPPTTPDPGSDFKCQDEGFFSHPRDCKKYFWCLDSGPSGLGIVANQFTCPSGLVFNKIADSCDYPRNVICPKTKNPTAASTTKAPKTTPRTISQEKTTRRTTTTKAPNSAEEYEYDDEDLNIAENEEEDEEEEILDRNKARSTTVKSLIYKTITRNRLTSTTTEAPTTTTSRNFKQNTHNVLDLKDEEDPRVLKELIDLIKKAGGLEQLEKQLNLQGKHSPDEQDNKHITPATISRSLYERVLNRQAPRISGLFSESTTRTVVAKNDVTERITSNSRTSYQNGPGGAQFEGLDDVPEVKSLRRTFRPQYVTIERPKPSPTQMSFADEDVDDDLPQQDEYQPDNTDVASSEERAISNPPDDDDNTSTKKATPNYVNIRRTRPSTPASNNDLEDKDEPPLTTSAFTESNEHQQATTLKSRYTNIQRFRSTTTQSTEPMSSVDDDSKPTENTLMFSIDSTTQNNSEDEKEGSATSLSPTQTSTFGSTLKETTRLASESAITTEFATTPRSILTTTQQPTAVDSVVAIIENFIAETPQTTLSVPTTSNTPTSKATTTPAQPRPFGFPRRGRPTTASISTTTDQNRIKVETKYFKKLPTLKELINNNIENNRNIAESVESETDMQIPVRLFGGPEGEEMISNQLVSLRIPESTLNSTIWRNILKTRSLNDSNYIQIAKKSTDSETKITEENVDSATTGTFTGIDDTSVTIPSTESVIRGFYVTKSLFSSQPETVESTDVEKITTDILEDGSKSPETTEFYPASSTNLPAEEYTLKYHDTEKQTKDEYLENTPTFLPTTVIDMLENNFGPINPMEDYQDVSTKSSVTDTTTSSVATRFTTTSTLSPTDSQKMRPIKQITVRRRPTQRSEPQSKRQHVASIKHEEIVQNMKSPRPSHWSRKIVKKRPISDSTSDQNIAETQPHELITRQIPPTVLLDVPNKMRSGDMNATEEINLFRSPTTQIRKPGTISKLDGHDRSRPLRKNPIGNMRISETQYSSKVSADVHDQSGRAQELLAVSIADPPTATSSIEIGNETAIQIRGIQKHKIGTRYDVHTEPPTIIRTTVTPVRRRQGPKKEYKINFVAPTSHRPAIIDYDYYVDEEVRLSIKPELKDKIFITKTGGIRCLDQGNFAHPTSCKKFITCAPMVGGQVIATEYTCPAKLSFDPVGGICNWSAGLGCTP